MSDPIRLTKTTIKETIVSDNSTTPATQQKQTQTGITAAKDSFQVKQESSLFTLNRDTGEVKFGDGVQGSRPPIGNSAQLLFKAKTEISGYLKGEAKTDFGGIKQYLFQVQNQQIGTAVNNLKHVGSEAKSDLANNPAFEARFQHFTSALNELEVSAQGQSKKLQQKANLQDAEVKHLENQADKDSDFAKASKAHTDHFRDAILDFIRKLHEIDPKILT